MADHTTPASIDQLWNDLFAGAPEPVTDETSSAGAVRHLTTLYSAPTPGAARERARQRVFDSDSIAKENTMSAVSVSVPIPASNGRVPLVGAREPYGASRSRSHSRLTWLAVAAAIVLLTVGSGGYFAYERFGSDRNVPAVIPAPQPSPEGNWPMDRGNPALTGVSAGFGPVGDPEPLWKFDTGGAASNSPIVVDGVVYGGSGNGSLYALDAATGAEIWRFQADMAIDMTPAYFDGTVYVPTQTGTLYAIDAKTGTERWHFDQGISFWSAPAFANGLVYAGSHDGMLYAIDAARGTVSWAIKASGAISQAPAVSDGVLYAGSDDGYLYALKASDGTQLWRTFIKAGIFGAPSIADGTAYLTISNGLSSPGSDLYAVDISTGAERYHRTFAGETSAVTVSDGWLYLGETGDGMHALAAADGSDLWTFGIAGGVLAAPALADGVLYSVSTDHTVLALDAATGAELWRFAVDGGVDRGPAVATGMIYVSTDAGTIYAIGGAGSQAVASPLPAASPVASPVSLAEPVGLDFDAVGNLSLTGEGSTRPSR